MQGRDSCLVDPANSIQQRKYAVYRTLSFLKSGTVFADCLKWQFSISFSEKMISLYEFRRSTFKKYKQVLSILLLYNRFITQIWRY